ncbi:hypothetical protein JNN96_37195 [Mycobacterium sp. DSM 3803]|nr:hypothetical protein [Mycobacterium sp. DSM 3803]
MTVLAPDPYTEQVAASIAHWRERHAAWKEVVSDLRVSGSSNGVYAAFDFAYGAKLDELTVTPEALAKSSREELAAAIKTVLADTCQQGTAQFMELYARYVGHPGDPRFEPEILGKPFVGLPDLPEDVVVEQTPSITAAEEPSVPEPDHTESSRSGAVSITIKAWSHVATDVELSQAVVETWTPQQIGERIKNVYTAATMAVAADARKAMNSHGANIESGTPGYPDDADVAEYRREYLDF